MRVCTMSWTQIRKYFWKPFKFSQNLDLSGWNPDKNVHKSCLSMLFIGRQAKISFTPWVLFPPRINSTCFRALWFGEHLPSSRYARGLSWWYTRGKCRICGGIPLRWHVRQHYIALFLVFLTSHILNIRCHLKPYAEKAQNQMGPKGKQFAGKLMAVDKLHFRFSGNFRRLFCKPSTICYCHV